MHSSFTPISRIALLCLLTLTLGPPVFAEGNAAPPLPAEMETVTVTGAAAEHLTGSNTLNRAMLEHLPARNGSINEAIGILPGVQLSEYSRTSDNAGEFLPPNLSISGGRFYENNFMIDGIGNNSLLDPAFDDTANVTNVAGHPQELFVNPRFIKAVDVYRFNVPARYGSFTGGVVAAETEDPSGAFGGEVYLRHTRNEWSELHYPDSRRGEFEAPRSGDVQPQFDKYDGGVSLDIPINEDNGLLFGYSRSYSKIPLQLIDRTENQYRDLENYFGKFVTRLGPETLLKITGIATPYEADNFLADTLASDYTSVNSAHGVSTSLEQVFPWGSLEFDLGYRNSENRRDAPANYFIWRSQFSDGTLTSKPWGDAIDSIFSKEGGYGDLEKEQSTGSAGMHLTGNPFLTGPVAHRFSTGISYEEAEAAFDRPQELTRFTNASPNRNVVCAEGAIDCISGDQFMVFKTVYPADHADTRIRFYDAYVEDTLTWGRVTLRPGLRFSYDDLQHNDNWAPRLAASYDLFGNGRTLLIGGLNRYYGKTLLTRALDEEKTPSYNQSRSSNLAGNIPSQWGAPVVSKTRTRLTELKTPYTNEWAIGIEQQLFDGLLRLDYVERDSEDEIAATSVTEGIAPNNYTYTEWTNDGNSQHRETTMSWERQWANHYLLLTASWQETETTNSNYIQRADSPDIDKDGQLDPVWYRGHVIDREDLPRPDFNREWAAVVTYTGRLPWGFTFTNVTRYRSGYMSLDDTSKNIVVDGEQLDIYEEIKQPESWIFDWVIEWEKMIREGQSLIVALEINNVFDEKVTAGESIDVYDLGRQVWLGLTYKF